MARRPSPWVGTSGGLESNRVDFTVTVTSVDDPPTGSQENITVTEDAANSVLPLANIFTDVDNPAADITAVVTNDNPDLLTATVDTANLTLAYHANQHGQAAITLTGTSGGLESNHVAFTVTVTSVNDPLLAADATVSVTEDQPSVFGQLTTTDADRAGWTTGHYPVALCRRTTT